jgi:hypothetical protein
MIATWIDRERPAAVGGNPVESRSAKSVRRVRISATPRERRELLNTIALQLTLEQAAALWSAAAGKGEPAAFG